MSLYKVVYTEKVDALTPELVKVDVPDLEAAAVFIINAIAVGMRNPGIEIDQNYFRVDSI